MQQESLQLDARRNFLTSGGINTVGLEAREFIPSSSYYLESFSYKNDYYRDWDNMKNA